MFESGFEKLARIITRSYGLEVRFQGDQAWTDGKVIYLPALRDASQETIQDMHGFLDHEAAHCIFTEFRWLEAQVRGGVKKFKYCENEFHANLLNGTEDIRINRRMGEKYPGSKYNINRLYEKLYKKIHDQWKKFDAYTRTILNITFIMDGLPERLDNDIAPLFTAELRAEIDNLNLEDSTEGQFEVTKRILKLLKQEEQNQVNGGDSDEEQDQDEQDQDEQDQDDSEGDDSGDSEGDSEGEGDSDGDSGDGEGEGEGESDSEGDSKGEGSEGSKDGKGSKPGNGEGEGEGETKGPYDGGTGSVSEQARADMRKAPAPKTFKRKKLSGDTFDGERDEKNPPFDIHSMIEAIIMAELDPRNYERRDKDTDEKLNAGLTRMTRYGFKKKKHIPFTTAGDEVIEHKTNAHAQAAYKRELEGVRGLITKMTVELERMLKVKANRRTLMEQEQGRLAATRLARLVTDPSYTTPFKRRVQEEVDDVAVMLVVDMSGSMGGWKIDLARKSAIAFAEALGKINIDCEVVGFQTKDYYRSNHTHDARFNRFNEALVHHVFKPFGSRDLTAIAQMDAGGANCDGESVRWAAKRLSMSRKKRKIMIVLSDGMPSIGETDHDVLNNDLREAVREIELNKIETVGIGIMNDAVKHFYKDHIVLHDINKLPTEVMAKLRKLLVA